MPGSAEHARRVEDGAVEEAGHGAARAAGLRPRARALRGALPAAGRPVGNKQGGQIIVLWNWSQQPTSTVIPV